MPASPQNVELVVVPKATNDWFFTVQAEVMKRITAWFEQRAVEHDTPPLTLPNVAVASLFTAIP